MKLGQGAGIMLVASILLAAAGCSTKAPSSSDSAVSGDGAIRTGPGVEGDVITLGVLTDLSGVFSAIGSDITNAQVLFWEQQNAGDKICGKYTVELDVQDTGYVPQQGVQLYSSIKDSILAMQQTIGSPVNAALAEDFTADAITNLPSAWARSLTEPPGNAVVGATSDIEMFNGLTYALNNNLIKRGDTLGHIYFEGEFGANGLAGSKAFAAKHDMNVLEAKIKATDQDMSSQMTQFKAAGIDALALTVAPGQTASAASVGASQGLQVPIIANNSGFAPGLLNGPAAAVLKENLILPSPINTIDAHPDLLRDYLAKFPNAVPSPGVVFGTAMAEVLRQILDKACADGDLTREGVLKAKATLADVDTKNLVVPLDFSLGEGKSPSRASYILGPVDAPGGLRALSAEPLETEDARELP